MVEPSLSTVFRRLENEASGVEKESFGNLIPLSNALFEGSFRQKSIFLKSPNNSLFEFNDIKKLEFKKRRAFKVKDGR